MDLITIWFVLLAVLWAGYLIVTLLLFAVAGILALAGIKALKKAKPVPEKAIRNAQETVEAIKR